MESTVAPLLLGFLRSLFADDAGRIVDDRQPALQFDIGDGSLEIYAPKLMPWVRLFYLVTIQSLLQCLFAIFIYYWIVLPRQRQTSNINNNSIQHLLVGWGLVLPAALYLPFGILEVLQTRNRVLNLSASTCMTVLVFRCLEAMYGTSQPPVVESSLSTYLVYYSSVVPFVWNDDDDDDQGTGKRQRVSFWKQVLAKGLDIGRMYMFLSLVLSLLLHFDYQPFGSTVALNRLDISWDLLSPQHLADSYLHALLIYGTLHTGFELTCFGEQAKFFVATKKLFNNPFLKSRSLTEFWTQRWNLLTQSILKTSVFLPCRRVVGGKVAVMITFLVSGLYHDYVWATTFYNQSNLHCREERQDDDTCYYPHYGRVTLFFAYVGVAMLLERPIAQFGVSQYLAKRLPSPVVAHLMLLVHLPVLHWYLGDWIMGKYFDHLSIGLFLIRYKP